MRELQVEAKELSLTTPVFLLHFSIQNGSSEYVFHKTVRAFTANEAEEKARKWLEDFWGPNTRKDEDVFWSPRDDGCVVLTMAEQVTSEQLIERLTLCG
jgi:uncharacterized protein YqjF (DUF2071 family)